MPGEGDIEITWKANQTQLMAALLQQQAALQKSIDKALELDSASKKAGEGVGGMFEKGLQNAGQFMVALTGVGSVMGGMLAVIGQIKHEYADLLARQREAAGTQITQAAALSEATRNLGDDPTIKSGAELERRLLSMSEKTGVSTKSLTIAASAALSSRGTLPATAALSSIDAAATLAPDLDEGGLTELSGAAMSLVRRGLSPQQALGFFLSVGKASPIRNLRDTARNVAPAINKVTGFGGSLGESGALVSALSLGMEDMTGEESATASIRLSEQLAERLPFLSSTKERIQAVQNDAKLQEKILGVDGGTFKIRGLDGKTKMHKFPQMEIRAGALNPVRDLLTNKAGGTASDYATFLKDIPEPGRASESYYAAELKKRGELPANKVAEIDRRGKSAEERLDIANTDGALTATVVDRVDALLRKSGVGAIERSAISSTPFMGLRWSRNQEADAADVLETQARFKRGEIRDEGYTGAEREAALSAVKEMESLAREFRKFVQAPVQVKVEVVAPKGVMAKPAAAGLDRR